MKLSKEIKSRKLEFSPVVQFKRNELYIPLIDVRIKMGKEWHESEKDHFSDFRTDFPIATFPEVNEEEEKRIKKQLFPPLFIIERSSTSSELGSAYILLYLFRRYALTGPSSLHIKSLVKLEQSWASYFINKIGPYNRHDIRELTINNCPACISMPMEFKCTWKHDLGEVLSSLRILMIDIDGFVLSFYFVDRRSNTISEEEINEIISGIAITNR